MKNIVKNKNIKKFYHRYIRLFLNIAFFGAILFVIYLPRERFGKGFKEGMVSPYNLYSPFNLVLKTEIDEEKTKREKQLAKEYVLDVYDYDLSKTEEKIKDISNFLTQIKNLKNSQKEIDLKEIVFPLQISHSLINNLLQIENLDKLEETFTEISNKFLPRPIIPGGVRQDLLKLNRSKILIRDIGKNTISEYEVSSLLTPEEMMQKIEEYLNKKGGQITDIKGYSLDLFRLFLEPNLYYNQDITSKFKQEAEERVRPIYKEIDVKRDELILAKGQRITAKEMRIIEAINRELGGDNFLYNFLGIGIIALAIFLLSEIYLGFYEPKTYAHLNELNFIRVLILFSLLVARIFYKLGISYFLIPLPAVAMLVSLLLGGNLAIKINVFVSILVVLILDFNFKYVLIFFISGMIGAFMVEKARRRSQVIRGGLGVGFAQFLTIFTLGILEQFNFFEVLKEASFGLSNGIISAFIALGSLSFFEYLFRLISNITLLELSDTNHPLLRELILKAPGTYHHSLIVGNLAESACEAIGANYLLARVGAYYHDIGKIDKAEYFSENRPHPFSKHTKLTPELSSLVIINHVKEGIEKAKKYKLNRKVIDIIEQHHGTSKVYYFYQRALLKEEEEGKEIDESRFCYPGPLPQTNEAAVVLLADSVEAASRTLNEPNPSTIRNLVKKILNNKFIEGQLNDCSLTLQDLNKISESFINLLLGIFHTRIKYPEIAQNGNRNNQVDKKRIVLVPDRDKEKNS